MIRKTNKIDPNYDPIEEKLRDTATLEKYIRQAVFEAVDRAQRLGFLPMPLLPDESRYNANLPTLKKRCLNFPGAIETLHTAPGNVLVYTIGGKSFAYFKTSEPEKWRFSIRVSPDLFLELTDTPGVKPARYMGRFHWATIVKIENFPEAYLMELLEWSYQKAFSALSRKKQNEISPIK